MNQLIKDIELWASARGIIRESDPKSQMLKTMEEVGELADAIGKDDYNALIDAIGDIAVTLIIQAKLNGADFEECVNAAFIEISQREGQMVNGMYVKNQSSRNVRSESS